MAHSVQGVARSMAASAQQHPWLSRVVLWVGLTVWVVNVLVRWWSAAPLGHDEARYALDARDLLNGTDTRFLYAGGGMSAIGMPGLLAGATEQALRLVPALLGAGFLAAAFHTARVIGGRETAAWTVGVLAGGRTFAMHASELLSDLPSAALLLVAIAILVAELGREGGPRWRLLAVAPLCAAAFHVRYGSCVPIAAIGVVFAVVAAQQGHLRAGPVIATLVATALLFVPHVMWSLARTGSPTGILQISSGIPPRPDSWASYLQRPFQVYGVLIAPLCVIGLFVARRGWRYAAPLWIALAQVGVLALTTQAQARYVFLGTVLLVILGLDASRGLIRLMGRRAAIASTVVGLTLLVASWTLTLRGALAYRELRMRGPTGALIAARVIAADHEAGLPCEVLGVDTTRLEWYSGCTAGHVASSREGVRLYQVGSGVAPSVPSGGSLLVFVPGVVDVVRVR